MDLKTYDLVGYVGFDGWRPVRDLHAVELIYWRRRSSERFVIVVRHPGFALLDLFNPVWTAAGPPMVADFPVAGVYGSLDVAIVAGVMRSA